MILIWPTRSSCNSSSSLRMTGKLVHRVLPSILKLRDHHHQNKSKLSIFVILFSLSPYLKTTRMTLGSRIFNKATAKSLSLILLITLFLTTAKVAANVTADVHVRVLIWYFHFYDRFGWYCHLIGPRYPKYLACSSISSLEIGIRRGCVQIDATSIRVVVSVWTSLEFSFGNILY